MKPDNESDSPDRRDGGYRRHGMPALKAGDRFGDCTIERQLGAGAMGQVYLAKAADGANYALKVLHPELEHRGKDMKLRFLHEAEFLMTIRHRNLVEVFDAGEDPECAAGRPKDRRPAAR